MVMTEPKVYTVEELAALLKVNPRTVYKMVDAGQIRSVRAGRQIRIPQEALDAYLRGAQTTEPTDAADVRRDVADHEDALEAGRRRIRGEAEDE
jgi:excisionase family DNA binding protein